MMISFFAFVGLVFWKNNTIYKAQSFEDHVTLSIPKSEYNLIQIAENELYLNETYYDVISKVDHGDTLIITLYKDNIELDILKILDNFLNLDIDTIASYIKLCKTFYLPPSIDIISIIDLEKITKVGEKLLYFIPSLYVSKRIKPPSLRTII